MISPGWVSTDCNFNYSRSYFSDCTPQFLKALINMITSSKIVKQLNSNINAVSFVFRTFVPFWCPFQHLGIWCHPLLNRRSTIAYFDPILSFLFLLHAVPWSYQPTPSISTELYPGCSFTGTHIQHQLSVMQYKERRRLSNKSSSELVVEIWYILKSKSKCKNPSSPTRHDALGWPSQGAKDSKSNQLPSF